MKISDFKGKKNVLVRIAAHKDIKVEYIVLQRISAAYDTRSYMYYFDGETFKNITISNDHKVAVTRAKPALLIKQAFDRHMKQEEMREKLYHGSTISATGSDPEIFAETKEGELIPAFQFLGSKEKPHIAPGVSYGSNKCYWDGYQAEFDTTAIGCHGWHLDSIQNGLLGVYGALKKFNPEAKLSVKTTFDIPKENLQSDADEHVNFGCMPSKNAYGMEGMKENGRNVGFRSAGGHIHLGLTSQSKKPENIIKGVKAMDAILGVACVSLFAKFDDARRRQMYGLAGEYRTPAHGVEYRVLSNAWLSHPFITNLVLDLSRKAFMVGISGLLTEWKCEEKETIRIINECDVDAARKVLETNKDMFKLLLSVAYGSSAKAEETLFNVFMKGMENVVENPADIEGNWMLNKTWITHSGGPTKNVSTSLETLRSDKKVS